MVLGAGEPQISNRLNFGTIGLAGGLLAGAPIYFATDIARIVNDHSTIRVLRKPTFA